jgi:acyl carrier protein
MNFKSGQDIIFRKLKLFVSDIIGADVAEELNISRNSIFTKDLEMDSIEIVSFIEKVNNYYGNNIDFANWLYGMDLNKLINLSMDSIVVYISENSKDFKR